MAADRVRTFVALSMPHAQRAALGAHLAGCARRAPGYRWVAPDALHLTLRFIGQLTPEGLARVRAALQDVPGRPFRLALTHRGQFGPRSAPRVIWLGVGEGAEACAELAAGVERACQAAGLDPEPRGFRAHVTLARARSEGGEGERLPALPDPPPLAPWTVDDFVLYESVLRGGRPPAYVPLHRFPLASSPRCPVSEVR
ncbi:MAG TPA: RNA 2',3'-cyclic phosphodiesterase [Methylomirabilota bacterium]|nr:RNA 2',3'-cyclic phosphodiesterase [Methylomirabilota bacterium]